MLEWACDEVAHLNRPATVDSMEAHFSFTPPEPQSPWAQDTSNLIASTSPEYPYPVEQEQEQPQSSRQFESSLPDQSPSLQPSQQNIGQQLPEFMSPSTFSGLFASLRSLKTAANMVLLQKDDRELVLFALEMLAKALEKADKKVLQNAY